MSCLKENYAEPPPPSLHSWLPLARLYSNTGVHCGSSVSSHGIWFGGSNVIGRSFFNRSSLCKHLIPPFSHLRETSAVLSGKHSVSHYVCKYLHVSSLLCLVHTHTHLKVFIPWTKLQYVEAVKMWAADLISVKLLGARTPEGSEGSRAL